MFRAVRESGLKFAETADEGQGYQLTIDGEDVGAPFVIMYGDITGGRRYKDPMTRVGPVQSGSLREFEETSHEKDRSIRDD